MAKKKAKASAGESPPQTSDKRTAKKKGAKKTGGTTPARKRIRKKKLPVQAEDQPSAPNTAPTEQSDQGVQKVAEHPFDSDPQDASPATPSDKPSRSERNRVWAKRTLGIAAASVFLTIVFIFTLVGRNDLHTWQVIQYLNNTVEVRNEPGWYITWFGRVNTYPRSISVFGKENLTADSPKDESVTAQFNDGGTAQISFYIRIETPYAAGPDDLEGLKKQREFHRQFVGNPENARIAVRSYARQCITQTGPIMSSSENQSARKAEFWKTVNDQLKEGLYEMRPVKIRRDMGVSKLIERVKEADEENTSASENPVTSPEEESLSPKNRETVLTETTVQGSETVLAAEVKYGPDGDPAIAEESPLKGYGMELLQFAITGTKYDPDTKGKFTKKKEKFLEAETSKATAIEHIQARFLRIATGDREIAQAEWEAMKVQTADRIAAELTKEVAEVTKQRKQVEAETLALVEEVKRETEELLRDIAGMQAQAALNHKKATTIAAAAREQEIEIGGAASERLVKLMTMRVEELEKMGEGFTQLQVPDVMIMAQDAIDPRMGTALEQALPSLRMMKLLGLLDENSIDMSTLRKPTPRNNVESQATTRVPEPVVSEAGE